MPSARRWQPEPPEIRASDAERERVVSFLRDSAAEGRLTADELDERVGRAYAAVTRGQLSRLVRDLPRPPVGTSLKRPRRHVDRRRGPVMAVGRPIGIILLAFAALAAMRLPGLLIVLVWAGFAVTVALAAVVAVLALVLSPVIALFVLAVVALRRRAMRSWPA
jgi:hypothetical protein